MVEFRLIVFGLAEFRWSGGVAVAVCLVSVRLIFTGLHAKEAYYGKYP